MATGWPMYAFIASPIVSACVLSISTRSKAGFDLAILIFLPVEQNYSSKPKSLYQSAETKTTKIVEKTWELI